MRLIKNISRGFSNNLNGLDKYRKDYLAFRPYQVKLYNWFRFSPYEWLPRFIYEKKILQDNDKRIAIFSVFGHPIATFIDRCEYKIFYTGENIHARFREYEGLMLDNKAIDLSLGFDYLEHEKYLRWPIWLMNLFEPSDNYETIKAKFNFWNKSQQIDRRNKFCSFLSRHDYFGDRIVFLNEIRNIDYVDCDGEFQHNNDDLKLIFNDNKIEYLRSYKFNLCPENSDSPGYCTEKLFEAIIGGCIPIYWGSANNPEPDVLNQNAILFLTDNGNNNNVLEFIGKLNSDKDLYNDFSNQFRFTDSAPDVVYEYFVRLEKKLKELVKH